MSTKGRPFYFYCYLNTGTLSGDIMTSISVKYTNSMLFTLNFRDHNKNLVLSSPEGEQIYNDKDNDMFLLINILK